MIDPWPRNQPPYFERVGIEFDTAINVLTGGPLGWTVSQRAAYGAGWRPSTDPATPVSTVTGAVYAGSATTVYVDYEVVGVL